MGYAYFLAEVAQQEYEEAISWYFDRSINAANGFIEATEHVIELICEHPTRWRNV